MSDERPILEVRQSAWQMSSLRDQRLRIFGDRVELVRPRVMGEARTTAISLSDIDYISTKDFLLVWSDLLSSQRTVLLQTEKHLSGWTPSGAHALFVGNSYEIQAGLEEGRHAERCSGRWSTNSL
jgi:hypothetical protein